MRPLPLLALAAALLSAACGPTAGEACQGQVFTCVAPAEALECREDRWRAVPCRGPGGCREASGTVTCDLEGNLEGDACALPQEGNALCAADGRSVLECRHGLLVRTRSCSSCTRSGTQLVCNP